jgi:hypothetical protein
METLKYLDSPGYKYAWKDDGDDDGPDMSDADVEQGYKVLYVCDDFDDMWEAFETVNKGVVGGQKTVDDFTPAGLSW